MGKQKIIIVLTVLFVTVSGIFYSVSYGKKEEAVFIAEENSENVTENISETESVFATEQEETAISSNRENLPEEGNSGESGSLQAEIPEEVIYVHVCGQVMVPGVYCLREESRVTDLVEMAGGFTEKAAGDYVNLAQKLADGQRIYIPSRDEVSSGSLSGEAVEEVWQDNTSQKVNINTADEEALMTLPGIGESKAAAIIRYREEHGGFGSIEELKQIEGIKDGVFNKIKDEITV